MKIIILKSMHIDFNLFKSDSSLHLHVGNNIKAMVIRTVKCKISNTFN